MTAKPQSTELPPEDMTDDELKAAIEFHERQAMRFKREGAKLWRLRLRIGRGEPVDRRMLADLHERRAVSVPASAAPVVDTDALNDYVTLLERNNGRLREVLKVALDQTGCDGDLCNYRWHEQARVLLGDDEKTVAEHDSIRIFAAEQVAHAAHRYLAESLPGIGAIPSELSELNRALNAWQAFPDTRASFDDSQPLLAALASLIEDVHATDHQRRIAHLALIALRSAAAPVEQSETADYVCDATSNCGWRSTDASRPVSNGIKVNCPNCSGAARFIGMSAAASFTSVQSAQHLVNQWQAAWVSTQDISRDSETDLVRRIEVMLAAKSADSSTSARAAAEEWFVKRGEKYPEVQPAIDELAAIIKRHFT